MIILGKQYNYEGIIDRSKEVLDAQIATHKDNSDGHSLEDCPSELVVVVLLLFTLVQEGNFRLVLIYMHDGVYLLILVDDQRLLQPPSLLMTTLTPFTPIVPLTSLTALTTLTSITGRLLLYFPLVLACQHSPFLLSHQTQNSQLLSKKPIKIGTSLEIPSLTFHGKLPPHIFWVTATSITRLLTIHETNCRQDQTTDIPGRCPGLLMVIGKRCADGEVDLESAGWSIEVELGRCKWVIFMELEETVIEASRVGPVEVVQAEVEVQMSVASNQGVGDRLLGERGLLLEQTLVGELAALAHTLDSKNQIIIGMQIVILIIGGEYDREMTDGRGGVFIVYGDKVLRNERTADGQLWQRVIIFSMKKYYQVLAIAHSSLELDDPSLLPLSQTKLNLIIYEHDPSVPPSSRQTLSVSNRFPSEAHQTGLKWEETLQLRYTGQKRLAIEVYAQGEAQQNAIKQIIYKGVYYIDQEQPSKKDTCHVYSPEGQKQGLIRWEISKAKREEIQVKEEIIHFEKPLIPQRLIGQIRIFQASLQITNPIFNKKKHPHPTLILTFDEQAHTSQSDQAYSWQLDDLKLEYFPESSPSIQVEITQQFSSLLNGSISCDSIRKLKRYVRHPVSLFNKYQIKVGSLWLELRYLDKEQLVTFVYSPRNNPDFTKRYKPTSFAILPLKPSPSGFTIMKRNQSFQSRVKQSKQPPIDTYALQNSDIFLPKTARFPQNGKNTNAYVSYIDPQRVSDFSPKRKKGWDMSLGRKFDFTRQYRGNPGVGTYKLPSIWGAK